MKKSFYLLSLFAFLMMFNPTLKAQDFESETEMMDQQDIPAEHMEGIGDPNNQLKKLQMDNESYDEEEDSPIPVDEVPGEESFESAEEYESY